MVDALGRRIAGVQVVAPSARAEAFVGEIKQALASGRPSFPGVRNERRFLHYGGVLPPFCIQNGTVLVVKW